jgi:hypothetical protein
MLCIERDHDGHDDHRRPLRWPFPHRSCKWLVHDLCSALHPGTSSHYCTNFIPLTSAKESAPARYRGLMIAVFQFWTSIGVLIGTLVDNATHKIDGKNAYMIPLGIIYVVPVFMSVGIFFIPESPRWLLYKDKNEEGLKSLMWMRPHPEAVPEEMADIQAAILAEKELSSSASLIDLLKNPIDRRRTLLAVAAISTQAASGAMFMIGECSPLFMFLQVNFLLKLPSIWNILLRNGEGRQCIPELMYSNCRWRYCDHREQLCHLQDRSTPCLPHGRHVHLRRLSVHRSCCVPRQSRHSRHWKGKPSLLMLLDHLTSVERIILTFI